MKSLSKQLKIKINTNLKAFKSSSSSHASPTSKHPPMLSTISESTSVKYTKKKKMKPQKKGDGNNNNIEYKENDNYHQQSPSFKARNSYNLNINNPSTPSSQRRYSGSPCIGYETPISQCNDNNAYNNAYNGCIPYPSSEECISNLNELQSPQCQSPITPKTPQHSPKSYRHARIHCKTKSKTKHFSLKDCQEKPRNENEYDIKQILRQNGYSSVSKLASTLQGVVFKAKALDGRCKRILENMNDGKDINDKCVVIKVTEKRWHEKSVAFVDGKEIPIEENIVDETKILRWLTYHHPPPAMTRFIDYFQDEKNIFLVMEDGGMDFFKFVAECHKLINVGKLSIHEWQCAIKVLFRQMIEFVDWMHTKMAVCHLDISLENLLISDVFVMSDTINGQQQIYLSHNFQIRFCDFGLATAFDGKDFRCNKYVGKTGYKAPKVYGKKKVFDARAADIWSLGIVLFMMIIGAPPFKRPSKKDYGFELIITGRMEELIESWGRKNYLTSPMFDLLQKMLQREEKRITMKEIKRHPWVKLN